MSLAHEILEILPSSPPSVIHKEIYAQSSININEISTHKSDVSADRVDSGNSKTLYINYGTNLVTLSNI